MKIAVVGCGAMGSIYAGLLASAGHEVLAITRRADHAAAMAGAGLRVEGASGDRRVVLRAATVVPAEPFDLVVIAVKTSDVAAAARQALPMVAGHTVVLAMQNGLGSADAVAGLLGADRLAVGIASGFGAALKGPGHVHHNAMKALRFGAYAGLAVERVQQLAGVWKDAGFDAAAVTDILAMQWEKLICNSAYSALCTLTDLTIGELMADPALLAVSRSAATEAYTVARALGVRLSATDPVELARQFGAQMPQARPSAWQDHQARRRSEIDMINGAVPRAAATVGLTAPVNATLAALVAARERAWGQDGT